MPGEMVVGGLSPLNRVHEILQRMIDNPRHIESLKTCCGVLAILSRDDANKLLIARDGIRLICSVMEQHLERHDLLEAACDLLWSLAFNNPLLKEVIGQQGCIPAVLRGMRQHPGAADFLKSSCGALSNMCQNPHNQNLIAQHGGVQCMLQVLEVHRANVLLLPFVFDALASLIVGNPENGRKLSEAGATPMVLSLMHEHLPHGELVKSGCHALAILSDNRGEGSKIAAAGGVAVLLPVLRAHPAQVDLHRVAAVVLLRMLQEAPVAADMARACGVPLMLNVLSEQIDEVETVAAGCHILYSITHPDALKGPPPIDLEPQLVPLQLGAAASAGDASGRSSGNGSNSNSSTPTRRSSVTGLSGANQGLRSPNGKNGAGVNGISGGGGRGPGASSALLRAGRSTGALAGAGNGDSSSDGLLLPNGDLPASGAGTLALVLEKHTARKDVARACVRSIVNLVKFPSGVQSLAATRVLEPMLAAVALHPAARDITEGALTLLKLLGAPVLSAAPSKVASSSLLSPRSNLKSDQLYAPSSSSTVNFIANINNGNSLSSSSSSSSDNNSSSKSAARPLPPSCVAGMLACVKARPGDALAAAVIFGHLEAMANAQQKAVYSTTAGSVGVDPRLPLSPGGRFNLRNPPAAAAAAQGGGSFGSMKGSPRTGLNATAGATTAAAAGSAAWEQDGVKVCLTWARLQAQSAKDTSASTSSGAGSGSSPGSGGRNSLVAGAAAEASTDPSASGSEKAQTGSPGAESSTASNSATVLVGEGTETVCSVKGEVLAVALAALCRFLHGFAERSSPGLAALRLLDTSGIVKALVARIEVERTSNHPLPESAQTAVQQFLNLLRTPEAAAQEAAEEAARLRQASLDAAAAVAAAAGGGANDGDDHLALEGVSSELNRSGGGLSEEDGSGKSGLATNGSSDFKFNSKVRTGINGSGGGNAGRTYLGAGAGSPLRGGLRPNKLGASGGKGAKGLKERPTAESGDAELDPEGWVKGCGKCQCRHGHSSAVLRPVSRFQQRSSSSSGDSTATGGGGALGSNGATGAATASGKRGSLSRTPRKRPRPVHPLDCGLDRSLLWNMPSYLEPIDKQKHCCANPSAEIARQEARAEDSADPSMFRAHVVYEGSTASGLGVTSRYPPHEPYQVPATQAVSGCPGAGIPFAHSLSFDACFESGNLWKAVQVGEHEYDLFLRPDVHTEGHMQWFYFNVGNTHPPAGDDNENGSLAAVEGGKDGASGNATTSNNNGSNCDGSSGGNTASSPKSNGDPEDDNGIEIKFNVVNLTKPDSLFNQGMQPLTFSLTKAKNKGQGWVRAGRDINYFPNGYSRKEAAGAKDAEATSTYFTLTFTLRFSTPGDSTLVTNAYPWTYADHRAHLALLLSSPYVRRHVTPSVLCQSLGDLDCDMWTITEDGKDEVPLVTSDNAAAMGPNSHLGGGSLVDARTKRKKCIVITGRVHPGETQASWMMKGILDFLCGDSPQARLLRSLFVFKVVPMLNPDGVAYGSNRCSLAGCDLNRQWKKPSRTLHPTIYYAKAMVRQEKAYRDVLLYVDLHGHSRKMNVFMYGCDDKKKPRPMSRIFPKLLSWNTLGRKYLSFADCSFSMKKGRESTARVVVAKELGIPNAFTLEGTFAGINFGPLQDQHLNGNHFQEMGHAVCDTLLDFYVPNRESNLSEKVGYDGIALMGKVAHATNKGAKPVLLRSLGGDRHNGKFGGGDLPGFSADDDDDDEDEDVQGGEGEGENGTDEQEVALAEVVSEENGNEEDGAKNGQPADGAFDEMGSNSDRKSMSKTGSSRRANDNGNGQEVPLSPEVVQAAAALAKDAEDSPSNRRVLEALAAADVAKNSSPSGGLKRTNSASSSITIKRGVGNSGDGKGDDGGEGGDGGAGASDEEDEDDGNDVDSGSEDGGDGGGDENGDNNDEAEGTGGAATASEPNSPIRRESKGLEGSVSSPLAMSGQRLLFEATADREPSVAPSAADLSPTKAAAKSFLGMMMPPAARDGRRSSATSNVSALDADGSVTCDEGAKGARLPLVPGIGSGNTVGSSGAGSGSSTGSMFGTNGRYRVNRQRSNRSLDGSGEGSVGSGGGKESSSTTNKGSPPGLAVDQNSHGDRDGERKEISASLAPTLPAVEFTGMQVRRLSASRSRGSDSGSGSGNGNGNGGEKPHRSAAAGGGSGTEQDGSSGSGGDGTDVRKSGDDASERNGSEGGTGTPGGSSSSKTTSGDHQSGTTKSGRSARGSTRKRNNNSNSNSNSSSASGSGSAPTANGVGGGMASAAQRLNHRRAGAAQAQANATGPTLGTLTASATGTTSMAGVEKYSGRLKAKARRVRKS